jgi:hypothetical protein
MFGEFVFSRPMLQQAGFAEHFFYKKNKRAINPQN